MNNLGEFIIKERKQRNLSQVELATKADITKSYLSKIERGKRIPELAVLKRIGLALEVPLELLVLKGLSNKDPFDIVVSLLDSISNDEDVEEKKREIIDEMIPIIQRLTKTFLKNNSTHPTPA